VKAYTVPKALFCGKINNASTLLIGEWAGLNDDCHRAGLLYRNDGVI
jgi:hypothetical protein